jgi:hypothetical protein
MKTKNKLSLLAILAVCVSCGAMPPAHKQFKLQCTLPPPNTEPVTGVNFYSANLQDTNWTLVATVSGTNGDVVSIPLPAGQVFTVDSTNAIQRTTSDYSPILTNAMPVAPTVSLK